MTHLPLQIAQLDAAKKSHRDSWKYEPHDLTLSKVLSQPMMSDSKKRAMNRKSVRRENNEYLKSMESVQEIDESLLVNHQKTEQVNKSSARLRNK